MTAMTVASFSGVLDRQTPSDPRAEIAVLGSLLIDRDAVIKIAPYLQPQDFHDERHGTIYEAVLGLYEELAPADFVTLCYELSRRGKLDFVGGPAYLTSLAAAVPTSVHIEYYARIIERQAALRRLISTGGQIASLGYREDEDVEQVLGEAQQLLDGVAQRAGDFWQQPAAILDGLFDGFADQKHVQMRGLATGFYDLDRLLGGLRKKEVYIVAARPGVGKSALVEQIGYNAARAGAAVGFVSLEMSADQLMLRMLAQDTGIATLDIESGRALGDDRLATSFGELATLPIFVADVSGVTPSQLRKQARALRGVAGRLDLLIIDYVQIMDEDGQHRHKTMTEEVSAISKGIKRLAKELDVPVLAVAQLNRATESRADHKPTLADLRQSGQLEQDAAAVLLMYRDELYNPGTEERGVVRIAVAKHRLGATGDVKLLFEAETTRFKNLAAGTQDYE